MKKIFMLMMAAAAITGAFTSCDLIDDGPVVTEEAKRKLNMSGEVYVNEMKRDGMLSLYVNSQRKIKKMDVNIHDKDSVVCRRYSIAPIDGKRFESEVDSLNEDTEYDLNCVIITQEGDTIGNEEYQFDTKSSGSKQIGLNILAKVETDTAIVNDSWNASLRGKVSLCDPGDVISRGFCYGRSIEEVNYQYTKTIAPGASLDFQKDISRLKPATKYYFRAFAILLDQHMVLGATKTFVTDSVPKPRIDLLGVDKVTSCSATFEFGIHGYAIDVQNAGICYSRDTMPTIEDIAVGYTDGFGTLSTKFNLEIKDFTPNTQYYARAYVTSYDSVIYTPQQVDFKTKDGLPIVTTKSVRDAGGGIISCDASVKMDEGLHMIEYGACYGTEPGVTVESKKVSYNSNFKSKFTILIKNLTLNKYYYVRPYVINEAGIGYGEEKKVYLRGL